MAKGIYCLKIYCFRQQFTLSRHELQALRRICIFTVTVYVKAWLSANSSSNAPLNDLCLLQTFESFTAVDNELAHICLKKMRGHLWYLSEDLIGLALFSRKVHFSEKKAMVQALKKPGLKMDIRRADAKSVQSFQSMTLSDFVTEKSLNLFTALKIDPTCVTVTDESSSFDGCAEYVTARTIVDAVCVVNDCAERAVKLATDFNTALTHDESQRQLIFQIVEYHRKQLIEPLKKNYSADYSII